MPTPILSATALENLPDGIVLSKAQIWRIFEEHYRLEQEAKQASGRARQARHRAKQKEPGHD